MPEYICMPTAIRSEILYEVEYELANIFIYLIRMADKLDINLLSATKHKLVINAGEYPVMKVSGSAKKYTEY